jgi:hypothetical protein
MMRRIPRTLWVWTGAWAVLWAFLVPALAHYGERASAARADHILLALFVLSFPASALSALPVTVFGWVLPDGGAGVVALLWWFAAGYGQWVLGVRLFKR